MSRPLQVIADDRGTVVTGFLATDVFYVRFIQHISSALGIRAASRIRKDLGHAGDVTCFFDVAATDGGDFAARSAIVRALLANRSKLVRITTLLTPGPSAARARALVTIPGSVSEVTESSHAFHAQMFDAAPFAQAKLPPARWAPAAPSMRPSATSMRPVARSLRPRARTGTYA